MSRQARALVGFERCSRCIGAAPARRVLAHASERLVDAGVFDGKGIAAVRTQVLYKGSHGLMVTTGAAKLSINIYMFDFDDINIYKLYALIGIAVALFFMAFARTSSKLRVTHNEFTIFLMFAVVAAHAIAFSEEMGKSLHIFQGILWLTVLFFIKINFGVFRALSLTDKAVRYSAYLIVSLNILALLLLGASQLSVERNFHGISTNANYLATLLAAICFPYFLGLLSRNPIGVRKILVLVTLFSCALLLALTRSRTGIISAMTAFAYFIYLSGANSNATKRSVKKLLLFCVFCGVVLFGADSIIYKYDGQDVFDTRSKLIQLRLDAIAERPLSGWGFAVNKFTQYDKFTKYNAGEKGNTPLALLEEMGIIFGSILVLSLIALFIRAIRIFSQNAALVPFALMLISSAAQLQAETWLFNFNGFVALVIWSLLYFSVSLSISDSIQCNTRFGSQA